MENKQIYEDWLTLSQLTDTKISSNCFIEVEKQYNQSNRHYHNVLHVNNLFSQIKNLKCSEVKKKLLAHAALFHDVVYISTAKDNEYQSAEFATVWLDTLEIDIESQQIIRQLILATATHTSDDPLIQLFLDMDLSILGSSPNRYQQYCDAIRKEYKNIPLVLYKRGRKRFLQMTLKRPHVFLTDSYQIRYEKQACINMQEELDDL